MGNIEVFNQNYIFVLTLVSLGFLLFSCFYASGDSDRLFAPMWMLFAGFAAEFGAEAIVAAATEVYAQGGGVESYIFAELLLLLVSAIFMGMAATSLMVNNMAGYIFAGALGALGVVAILLFVFIIPDGNIVNSMRFIFPLAGFACVALGFWAKAGQEHSGGFLLGAVAATAVSVLILLKFFSLMPELGMLSYVPALFYLIMAFAFMMMKSDILYARIEKANLQIEKYNDRIEEMIRLSPFPIIISRLGDDKIILANNNACKLFGINPKELDRYHLKDFFADSDNRRLLTERLESEKEVQDFEILVKTPTSDTPFWLLASANVMDYNYDLVLYSAFQDITSRKNRENLLKNQAIRDPLTSLYNRRYFEEEVSRQILALKAKNSPYSVLMLDADFFKKVNDTYGHKTGDKVLIELASTAERALRDNDIVARYGGEEFVVFLPGIKVEDGRGVADRLRQSIGMQTVYSDDNAPVKFTVSIGVSSSEISDNVDMLIKTADEALYKAKQNGRNRVEVFEHKDLEDFVAQGQVERKDESQNHHPIFDKENNSEISLLDGIEANKITDEQVFVEEKKES
ncbi:MAG: diguanylate cyclase [Proteobacteria bacterium]|nr:diguanylate cyclase [Pseudomonadota bacterium]